MDSIYEILKTAQQSGVDIAPIDIDAVNFGNLPEHIYAALRMRDAGVNSAEIEAVLAELEADK